MNSEDRTSDLGSESDSSGSDPGDFFDNMVQVDEFTWNWRPPPSMIARIEANKANELAKLSESSEESKSEVCEPGSDPASNTNVFECPSLPTSDSAQNVVSQSSGESKAEVSKSDSESRPGTSKTALLEDSEDSKSDSSSEGGFVVQVTSESDAIFAASGLTFPVVYNKTRPRQTKLKSKKEKTATRKSPQSVANCQRKEKASQIDVGGNIEPKKSRLLVPLFVKRSKAAPITPSSAVSNAGDITPKKSAIARPSNEVPIARNIKPKSSIVMRPSNEIPIPNSSSVLIAGNISESATSNIGIAEPPDSGEVIKTKIPVIETVTTYNDPTNSVPFSDEIFPDSPIPVFDPDSFKFGDEAIENESELSSSGRPQSESQTSDYLSVPEIGNLGESGKVEIKVFRATKTVRFFLKSGGENNRKKSDQTTAETELGQVKGTSKRNLEQTNSSDGNVGPVHSKTSTANSQGRPKTSTSNHRNVGQSPPKTSTPIARNVGQVQPKTSISNGHNVGQSQPKTSTSNGQNVDQGHPKTSTSNGLNVDQSQPKTSTSNGQNVDQSQPKTSTSNGQNVGQSHSKTSTSNDGIEGQERPPPPKRIKPSPSRFRAPGTSFKRLIRDQKKRDTD